MFNALLPKPKNTQNWRRRSGTGGLRLIGIPGQGGRWFTPRFPRHWTAALHRNPGEAEATRFAGDLNALGVAAAVFPARDYAAPH